MINPIRHILVEKFSLETAMEEYLIGQLMNCDIELNYHSKKTIIELPVKNPTIKTVSKINLLAQEKELTEIIFNHKITYKEMAFFDLQLNQFGICQVLFDECVDFNPTLYDISIYHKMVKIYVNVLERYLKTNRTNRIYRGYDLNKDKRIFNVHIDS